MNGWKSILSTELAPGMVTDFGTVLEVRIGRKWVTVVYCGKPSTDHQTYLERRLLGGTLLAQEPTWESAREVLAARGAK